MSMPRTSCRRRCAIGTVRYRQLYCLYIRGHPPSSPVRTIAAELRGQYGVEQKEKGPSLSSLLEEAITPYIVRAVSTLPDERAISTACHSTKSPLIGKERIPVTLRNADAITPAAHTMSFTVCMYVRMYDCAVHFG